MFMMFVVSIVLYQYTLPYFNSNLKTKNIFLGRKMHKYNAPKRNTFVYISDDDGHAFTTNKTKGNTLYMVCRKKDCPVTLVYDQAENVIKSQKKEHNHVKEPNLSETLLMRSFLREKSESNHEKFEKIFFDAEVKFPAAASEHGNVNYYRSSMRRSRRFCNPVTPNSFAEIQMLFNDFPKYSTDLDDPAHAFFDDLHYASDGSQILVFASHRVLEVAKKQATICIQSDATYKCLPKIEGFYQLFIASYQLDRNVYPMMYAIMEKKTEKAYFKVFEILKTFLGATEVNTSMTDYETALRKAIKKVYPQTLIKGCFFHYKKAVSRRIRKLGLDNPDRTPGTIDTGLKYAANLALLPETAIADGIALVESKLDSPACLQLLQYIRRTWANEQISVYKDLIRTNNGSEAMHRRIIALLGSPHPSIFVFIEFFQKFEHHMSLELVRDLKKTSSSVYRKKQYIKDDERISKAGQIFEINNDVDMFLSNVCGVGEGTFFVFLFLLYVPN